MSQSTIAFIGAGNMATSLIAGLIADNYPAKQIVASNPNQEKLDQLQAQYGIVVERDNLAAAKTADVIVLAVKPQIIRQVCQQLAEIIEQKRPLVMSVAAGVSLTRFAELLGDKTALVRCMPNTPAMVGCGATGLLANALITDQQRNTAESIMRSVGVVEWVDDEDAMNSLSALTASGPAYCFLVMEAMSEAAVQLGMEPDTATLLTLQTMLGSVELAMKSEESLADLRKQVTSPGGMTAAALASFASDDIKAVFARALQAAKKRAIELGEV